MSKNIVIQEGGTNKTLGNTAKLKTSEVGGGSCKWVPEDEVQLTTSNITANGTFAAVNSGYYGYSQVTVNVPGGAGGSPGGNGCSVVGKDTTTSNDKLVSVENGNVIETVLPSKIVVTTNPTKTEYEDGEAIDYTGMVVKAYTRNNTLWTSEAYPQGIIPISALQLPETTADIEEVENEGMALVDPVYGGVAYTGTIYGTTLEGNSYVYVSDNGQEGMSRDIYAVMPYPNTYYTWVDGRVIIATSDYNAISYGGTNYPGFWVLRRASGTRERATSVMHDGKTAYVYAFNAGDYNISETVPTSHMTGLSNLIIGWIMVYGSECWDPQTEEITYNTGRTGGQNLPVKWPRPHDSQLLETSVAVKVSEAAPVTEETNETT